MYLRHETGAQSFKERQAVITIVRLFKKVASDDRGATAIEYALIASILGIALLPVLSNTTSGIASLYIRVQGYFDKVS